MLWKLRDHLKKYPGLIPQFCLICVGMGGAFFYFLRVVNEQRKWNNRIEPEPWNQIGPVSDYKFEAINTQYKNLKK